MKIVPVCPDCGGSDIGHVERALVAYRALSFEVDEHDLCGTAFPEAYSDENIWIDWDTSDPVDYPWTCMSCHNELYWDESAQHLISSVSEEMEAR